MSQPEQFENNENRENSENKEERTMTDPYTSESSEDIYNTPDILQSGAEEHVQTEEEKDTQGLFSGNQQVSTDPYQTQQNPNTYAGGGQYGNYNSGNNPYGGNAGGGQYGNYNSGNNPYGGNAGGGQYGNYNSGNNPYGGNAGGGQYGNYNSGNNPYGGNHNGGQYGNYNAGNNPYGGNHNGNQYGNGQYGNGQYNNQPYGTPPYGGNIYSPYAAPQKKSHTGLIIGIVIAVIVLFLVAVFALAYKAVTMVTKEQRISERIDSDDYNFDDDYDYHHDEHDYDYDDYDDYDYDYGYDDDYGYDYDYDYDDDYGYDYDYDYDYDSDEYYTLHDDLKYDLSYSVYFENYEYDTDNDNIFIMVTYPVIEGDDIPNLDKINEALMEESEYFTDFYEEEYKDFIGDDGYFEAYSAGYVTYMDEKKMSVVFSENISTDYYDSAYLYCINIDLENGVVLDNEQLLSLDDDFSVEFRQRSDIQNGEISYLTSMTDQEITDYLNSSDVIVFYTPQGMEIGFNYEEGWVTVTYDEEYQQYLKIF